MSLGKDFSSLVKMVEERGREPHIFYVEVREQVEPFKEKPHYLVDNTKGTQYGGTWKNLDEVVEVIVRNMPADTDNVFITTYSGIASYTDKLHKTLIYGRGLNMDELKDLTSKVHGKIRNREK